MFTFNQWQITFRSHTRKTKRLKLHDWANQMSEKKLRWQFGNTIASFKHMATRDMTWYDTKKLAYKIFTEVILIYSLHDKKKHDNGLWRVWRDIIFEQGKITFCDNSINVLPYPTRGKLEQTPVEMIRNSNNVNCHVSLLYFSWNQRANFLEFWLRVNRRTVEIFGLFYQSSFS